MQRAAGHLGRAQRAKPGQVEHKLRRRLGAGGIDKLEAHAVDAALPIAPTQLFGGRNQPGRAIGQGGAEPRTDVAERTALQHAAKHQGHPPGHVITGEQVLGDGGIKESPRSENRHTAAAGVVLVDHTAHSAEVIGVTVGVDDAGYRTLPQRLVGECQGRGGGFAGGQRIDDNPAALAANQRHNRQVVAAHLVDAVHHLEQAV